MKKFRKTAWDMFLVVIGAALFAVGFDLFLVPNDMNAGGMTGLAMVIQHFIGIGTVGTITTIINLPLFAIGGLKIGKKFFFGSIVGLLSSTILIDMFAVILPVPQTEPLIAALYGGLICGAGLGIVFMSGASTGGSDIVVRLLKLRYQNVPIGTISICFDVFVVALTAIVFKDFSIALYSGISAYVSGLVVDAVVYSFDYSKVALIVTNKHEEMALQIERELDRGATFLHAEGSYRREPMMVVMTAVKRQQVADLKRVAMEVDPQAFVVVQEAHQVLGEGFSQYSKHSL